MTIMELCAAELAMGISMQPGRKGHTNVQVTLHFDSGWGRRQIPTLVVVPSHRASGTHLKPTQAVTHHTQRISLCARPRHTRLYAKAIRTHRLCHTDACQTRRPPLMGHKDGTRFQPGHIDGAPPMLQSICHKDKSNKDQ